MWLSRNFYFDACGADDCENLTDFCVVWGPEANSCPRCVVLPFHGPPTHETYENKRLWRCD